MCMIESPSAPMLSGSDLVRVGRELTPPFRVALNGAEGHEWTCSEVFRVLPGRRIVARAHCDGAERLLKAFVGPTAGRDAARDRRGIEALQRAGVPTPALLGEAEMVGGGRALLLEYLPDARALHGGLLAGKPSTDVAPEESVAAARADGSDVIADADVMRDIVRILARLHSAGLIHTDLHIDNFLRSDGALYIIDGAAVRAVTNWMGQARSLGRRRSLANLALFLAELPQCDRDTEAGLYAGYAAQRHWPVTHGDRDRLGAAVRLVRHRRRRRYLAKTLRDCGEFDVSRSFGRLVACRREARTPALTTLIERVAQYMDEGAVGTQQSEVGRLLKAGNSATVVAVCVADSRFVVKRYNIKSAGHWLRRTWRPTRAQRAWQYGNWLQLLGIATARPLALIENRTGPLRHVSYLITEALPGPDLASLPAFGETVSDETLDAVATTFVALAVNGLVHGDTKASNFIVTGSGIALVDLDSMHAPRRRARFKRAFRQDVERFLRNELDAKAGERLRAILLPLADPDRT